MTGKIKLEDVPFGTLNNLADGGGPSTDRRRTDPLEFLRLSTEAAYGKNTLRNKDTFNGIVVASRVISYPSYKNKTALFEEYLVKTQENTPAQEDRTSDYNLYAYKVYIPELEPRCIPKGTGDPVLVTYPDVYSDMTDGEIPIPNGTLVSIKYDDVENLFNPRIVAKTGGPIQLAGFDTNATAGATFQNGVVSSLDLSADNKNLINIPYQNIPDFDGPTFNADDLREALMGLGYTEKGNEISNGGDINSDMSRYGIAVFEKIRELYPTIDIEVTGGNDKYHQQLNYNSRHKTGNALDFVIFPDTEENIRKVEEVLQGFSAGDQNFRYLNEYDSPTKAATAKHFHISYRLGGTEAQRNVDEAVALADIGAIKVYTIQ
jgi:hypothetical protein